ncbi:uncharacterized protein LOC113203124 isoform X1 [Frankliniella occidentalis]|uniref:Uncharacterized protein LOC113203124 isoform X1 n=1 Tax=Frankliniella occidentalis TaxID=133901 RepID=A0A9C6XR79_FRAOC|nr:uncharacterized protein LOC113203124 isoform X1 [Frankliniella occidentalis]
MIMASTLLALTLCSAGIQGKAINSVIGPFIAYAERFYMCETDNQPLLWRWFLRATHFNPLRPKELQRLTGNVTATGGLLDDSDWGPYIAYVERFYMCEPDNRPLPWRWVLRATHFNPFKPKELQRVTGNLTFSSGLLDDSDWVKVIVDTRSNNQWKENAYVLKFNDHACRAIKVNIPGFYEQFLKKREVKGACLFRPGVYETNDAPLNWTFPNVPALPYGQYRFRLMIGKAKNLYACFVADARAVPKTD